MAKDPRAVKTASRVTTAKTVRSPINRITAKASSRTAASRAASRAINRAKTRMVTTRMGKTSSSRAAHNQSKASKALNLISNKTSSSTTRITMVRMTTMVTASRMTWIRTMITTVSLT